MNKTVFLAYPLTAAVSLASNDHFVSALRSGFLREGWHVRPDPPDEERLSPVRDGVAPADRLSVNLQAVASADALVVLVPDVVEPSSIWVELGVALATRVPVVVVAPATRRMPYLAQLAIDACDGRLGRVTADVPPMAGQTSAIVDQVLRVTEAAVEHRARGG